MIVVVLIAQILGQHWAAQQPSGINLLSQILPQLQQYLNAETLSGNQNSPFLELTGPSCSGKTQLLYYIVAISVLPKRFRQLKLPGLESCFAVIDTAAGSSGFNVHRLASIIRHVVNSAVVIAGDDTALHEDVTDSHVQTSDVSAQLNDEDLELLVQISLRHILIYKPASQNAVLSTLDSFESTLLGESTHLKHLQGRPLAGIAVDSVSSFYWQNRALSSDLVQAGLALEDRQAGGSFSEDAQKSDNTMTKLTTKLLSIANRFQCFVIVTSWITASLQFATSAAGIRRPVLPSFQYKFPGLRIVLVQSDFGDMHFAQGISAEEAWEEYVKKAQSPSVAQSTGNRSSEAWQKSIGFIDNSVSKFTVWIGDGVVVK